MSSSKRKVASAEEQRQKAQQWRDHELNSNKKTRTRSKSPGAALTPKVDVEEQRFRAKLWSETELHGVREYIPVHEEVIRSPMRPQQQQRGREAFSTSTSISASPKRPMVTSKPFINSFRKPSPSPSRVKHNSTTYTTYIKDISSPVETPKSTPNWKSSRRKGPFAIEATDFDAVRCSNGNRDNGYAFGYKEVGSSDDGDNEVAEKVISHTYGRDNKENTEASVDTAKGKGKYDGYIVVFFLSLGFGFSILDCCKTMAGPALKLLTTNYILVTVTAAVLSLSIGGVQLYFYRSNYLRLRKCVVNRVAHLIVSLLGNVPEDYLDGYPIDFLAHDVIQEIQIDSWEPSSDITVMYTDVRSNPRVFIEGAWRDIKTELAKDNRIKTLDRLVDGKQHKCYKLRGIRATISTTTPKQASPSSKLFHY